MVGSPKLLGMVLNLNRYGEPHTKKLNYLHFILVVQIHNWTFVINEKGDHKTFSLGFLGNISNTEKYGEECNEYQWILKI